MILHKHLLINAKINNPLQSEEQGVAFLRNLVEAINMKIIQGPYASYVTAEGNKGLTAIVMIETSHIAFHIWDEPSPALLQFDLYTCGTLDKDKVLNLVQSTFDCVITEYILFDREHGFAVEEEGYI